jgi:hypothetical protein
MCCALPLLTFDGDGGPGLYSFVHTVAKRFAMENENKMVLYVQFVPPRISPFSFVCGYMQVFRSKMKPPCNSALSFWISTVNCIFGFVL